MKIISYLFIVVILISSKCYSTGSYNIPSNPFNHKQTRSCESYLGMSQRIEENSNLLESSSTIFSDIPRRFTKSLYTKKNSSYNLWIELSQNSNDNDLSDTAFLLRKCGFVGDSYAASYIFQHIKENSTPQISSSAISSI